MLKRRRSVIAEQVKRLVQVDIVWLISCMGD